MKNKLEKSAYLSVVIPILGVFIQLISVAISLAFSVVNRLLTGIFFLIPLFSILGLFISVYQLRKSRSLLPIIGLLLNIFWIIAFGWVLYYIFSVEILG